MSSAFAKRASKSGVPESPPSSAKLPLRLSEALAVVAAALVLLAITFRPAAAVDLFWLLKLGQIIEETGTIPRTDLFSAVHPDAPWVHFQWLWEWTAWWITDRLGFTALRAINALALTIGFLGLYAVMRERLPQRVQAFALTAFAAVLFQDRFQLRPDVFNFVLWVAALPAMWRLVVADASPPETAPQSAEARKNLIYRAIALAAVAAFWSNLHGGGVLLLLMLMGAAAAGVLWESWRGKLPRARTIEALVLLGAASIGALANPAFFAGLQHFAVIFRPMMKTGNEEWMPSYTILRYGWHPNFLIVAIAPLLAPLWWLWKRRGRPTSAAEWLLVAVCAVLSNLFVRGAYLAVLPVALAARHSHVPRWRWAPSVLAAGLAAVVLHYNTLHGRTSLLRTLEINATIDLEPVANPEHAGRFLAEAGIQGGILNEGRWAGYLIWSCWPKCTVFADSRHHLTPEMWRTFRALHDPELRSESISAASDSYALHLAVFSAPTFPLLVPPPDWELIYKAGPEEVYLRRTPQAAANRARAAQWLKAKGAPIGPTPSSAELAQAAILVGSQDWLTSPWMRLVWQDAQEDSAQSMPAIRARGLRRQAHAFFEAGLYSAALESFAAAAELESPSAKALARQALAAWMVGEVESARKLANRARSHPRPAAGLERRQLEWLLPEGSVFAPSTPNRDTRP